MSHIIWGWSTVYVIGIAIYSIFLLKRCIFNKK